MVVALGAVKVALLEGVVYQVRWIDIAAMERTEQYESRNLQEADLQGIGRTYLH